MPSFLETLSTISCSSEKQLKSLSLPTESSFKGQEEITLSKFENYIPNLTEADLGMITREIDKFEQRINELRAEIRRFRRESINMLTTEKSDFEMNCDKDVVTGALSYLEVEQAICRLEKETRELESKRQEAISRLQNKMLGNILGIEQKDLLPLVPIPIPEVLSAPQAVLTSLDESTTESTQLSRPPTSCGTEIINMEESSTQNDELNSFQEEKSSEKYARYGVDSCLFGCKRGILV